MKLSNNYLLNLVTTFLSQACSAGLIIFLIPILQKNFTIENFSNYGVLLNIIVFTAALDFGLNIGLMRRLIQETDKASILISTTFFFFLGLFFIMLPLFILLFNSSILPGTNRTVINAFFVAILVIQTIIASLFDVILQSENKIFVGKLVRIGKTLLEFVLLYLVSKEGSVTLLLLVSAAVNFVYMITLYYFSKQSTYYQITISAFNILALFDHIKYSFWYFLNSIGVVIVFNSQVILLNALTTKSEVASYFLVTRFLDVVRLGTTNFTIILFPSLAKKEANGEWNDLRKTYFKVFTYVFILSVTILIFLLTVGRVIFQYWSGQTGYEINQVFTVFSIFTILIVIDNVSAVFLHAFRLNKVQTIISLIQGSIALILGSFLLQRMGIIGFAIASIVALLFTNFWYNPTFLISQFKQKQLKGF